MSALTEMNAQKIHNFAEKAKRAHYAAGLAVDLERTQRLVTSEGMLVLDTEAAKAIAQVLVDFSNRILPKEP